MQSDRYFLKRAATAQLIIYGIVICWSIGLCFGNYYTYHYYTYGVETICHWKYDARIKCKQNGELLPSTKLSDTECKDEYQCNCIKAAFPLTIMEILGTILAIIITVVKHSTFPRNSGYYNMAATTIVTISSMSLISIAIALIFSLGNDTSLNGWILASQILIAVLLLISLKFIRDEEIIAREIGFQSENRQETEIKALTIL